MVSEAWVQYEILRVWGNHDEVFMWRQNTGAAMLKGRLVRFGIRGACDIFSITRGRFVGIETKTEDGQQSPAQRAFQRRLEQVGGIYVLARGLSTVDEAYAKLGVHR